MAAESPNAAPARRARRRRDGCENLHTRIMGMHNECSGARGVGTAEFSVRFNSRGIRHLKKQRAGDDDVQACTTAITYVPRQAGTR